MARKEKKFGFEDSSKNQWHIIAAQDGSSVSTSVHIPSQPDLSYGELRKRFQDSGLENVVLNFGRPQVITDNSDLRTSGTQIIVASDDNFPRSMDYILAMEVKLARTLGAEPLLSSGPGEQAQPIR